MLLDHNKGQTAIGYEFSFGYVRHKQKAFFVFLSCVDVRSIMATHEYPFMGIYSTLVICGLLQSIRGSQSLAYSQYTASKHKPTDTSQYQYYSINSNLHCQGKNT